MSETKEFPTVTLLSKMPVSDEYRRNASIFEAIHAINFDKNEEYIAFCNIPNFYDAELCTKLLIHEVNHWAHDLYLNKDESILRAEKYTEILKSGRTPFTEWINTYAGYSMKEWEEKYNKKYDLW